MKDLFPVILIALWLASALIFFIQYKKERRGLLVALYFLLTLLSLSMLLGYLVIRHPLTLLSQVSLYLAALLLISLLFFPLILLIGLFFSAIEMIRKEGRRLPQLLSLGLGFLYLAYLIVWPQTKHAFDHKLPAFLYYFLSFCFGFTSLIFTLYSISSLLNLIKRPGRHYDYIIVLGSGLKKGMEVTPLLASRIEKGMEACHENPGSLLILSGGRGADEKRAEGEAMRAYALKKGIPEETILVEDRSRTTKENLIFSKALIDAREAEGGEKKGRILVVTNRYHLLRALMLARDLAIPCDGRGAKTKLYFSINALIREWVAYLVMRRRLFILVFSLAFLLLLLRAILPLPL